ncbi:MAG: hypothetical protein HY343_07565 [Lentisphaerae bacterium]|nr:hypothetical protein [Lentisphaerota bacterium]
MTITFQLSGGNLRKEKAQDVGALAGVFNMTASVFTQADETAKLNPPDLAKLGAADKLAALQELHAKAYDKDAALRAMLFDLKSLDVVRVIENVETPAETKEMLAEK